MANLTALETSVTENTTVIGSAVVLMNGLKAALDAAGTDPVKLKALSDQLGINNSALAAAVAANTPAVVVSPPVVGGVETGPATTVTVPPVGEPSSPAA